jgi:hypothetical protein
MTKTTIETITIEQIETLRAEAASAGDVTMADMAAAASWDVEHNDRATGNVRACVVALNDAEAQA